MRERVKSIYLSLHNKAFESTDESERFAALQEISTFVEHLMSKGQTYFMDVYDIYRHINDSIRKHCMESTSEGFCPVNNEELAQLIEWLPLDRTTVEVMSINPSIRDDVIFAAVDKLIEQSRFWDEEGSGPESLIETLYLDGRTAAGFHYLEGLRSSGEDEAYLAQAYALALYDALKSDVPEFIEYFVYRDEDLASLLAEHNKLTRFNFKSAAFLSLRNANSLALRIGKELTNPTTEDLLMLDAEGKVDFIESCIALNQGDFEEVRAREYLTYLTRASVWPDNAFRVELEVTSSDLWSILESDTTHVAYNGRGPALIHYCVTHYKDTVESLGSLLQDAVEREWIDQEFAVDCLYEVAGKFTTKFHDIIEIFRTPWADDIGLERFVESINKVVIWYLEHDGQASDIISVFNDERLLKCLHFEDLARVIDGFMHDSTPKTQSRIVESIPERYHQCFNSIQRFKLENDLGL